jgi:hypothetical protein
MRHHREIFMSRTFPIAVVLLLLPLLVYAQDDDVSLGDLARAVRVSKTPTQQNVIDNDNLNAAMDKAESERLNGKPVFSIDPSGSSFRMTSPDGTCSLSFDAKATALISTPYVASELPQDELLKLEGPAAIHDGVLEVSLHNGSQWELKEIVVGITVPQNSPTPSLKPAMLGDVNTAKLPDLTMLYHLKAVCPPDAITTFRGNLGGDLDSTKDWRWSLVSARGIPPAAPGSVTTAASGSESGSSSAVNNDGPSTTPSGSATQPYPTGDPYNNPTGPAPINAPPPRVASQH